MRKKVVLVCLVLMSVFFNAQTKAFLLNQLQTAKHDTDKCDILAKLIDGETDNTIWIKYNVLLEQIALKNKDVKQRHERIFYLSALSSSKTNWGFYYEIIGVTDSALKYYRAALQIQFDIKDRLGAANTLNNLGGLFNKKADFLNAINYFEKSLKINTDINDKQGVAISLVNLASIYKAQEDTAKAIEYVLKSLVIRKKINDKRGTANCFNNLATIYFQKGNKNQAIDYANKALKISQEIDDVATSANTVANLGQIYFELGDLNKALKYLEEALVLNQRIANKQREAIVLFCLGNLHTKLNQLPKAKLYFEKSLLISKELGFPSEIVKPAKQLYLINKKEGNTAKALELLELHTKMQDSLSASKTILSKQNKIQLKICYAKLVADSIKNQKNNSLNYQNLNKKQAQLEQQKKLIIGLITALIVLLVLVIFMFFRKKNNV